MAGTAQYIREQGKQDVNDTQLFRVYGQIHKKYKKMLNYYYFSWDTRI